MKWWVSCRRFTVQVNTNERRIIVWGAPIVRKFVGQPLRNLERWAGVRAMRLMCVFPGSDEEDWK